MSVRYSEDFKKEVVKAYMAGDKSIPQLAVEFNVAKSSVSKWVNEYKEDGSISPVQPQNLMMQRKSISGISIYRR